MIYVLLSYSLGMCQLVHDLPRGGFSPDLSAENCLSYKASGYWRLELHSNILHLFTLPIPLL